MPRWGYSSSSLLLSSSSSSLILLLLRFSFEALIVVYIYPYLLFAFVCLFVTLVARGVIIAIIGREQKTTNSNTNENFFFVQ